MVRKYAIVALLGVLISSCAQVGVISGGDVDHFAPKPITEKVVPANESTNFVGNTIKIPFNEYFRLVNPVQNIRMVPPHASVTATVNKKTLILSWEDTLESNTTYAIYLNDAIKDLTEGNDTIIQYVFSTGSVLDTLSYSVPVIDAWTGIQNNDCVVALFDEESDKLVSFTKPTNGVAKLNYLKSGTYSLVAFNDENNDLKLQEYERIGFPETGKVSVFKSWFDSIPLRMYSPKLKDEITNVSYYSPRLFRLGTNAPINNPKIYVDGNLIDSTDYIQFGQDSLLIVADAGGVGKHDIVLSTPDFIDTSSYSVRIKDLDQAITIKKSLVDDIDFSPGASFYVNDKVEEVQGVDVIESFISIIDLKDSTELITDKFSVVRGLNSFVLSDIPDEGKYSVTFRKGTVKCVSGVSEEFTTVVEAKGEDDYGEFLINASDYTDKPVIVDVMQGKKLVRSYDFKACPKQFYFTRLLPGDYTFRVIHDVNSNGIWDAGDHKSFTQPERVDHYSKKSKLRAKWTVEVTLEPTN